MKQVELLAPAGNYEALEGAVCAGADAVYLGGNQFGARAYADNFTQEELCRGIRMAHIYGTKIYLTVNILVKEAELPELISFLKPMYEAGLDGVIVQDLGAVRIIQRYFPLLPMHASTQMTITGSEGARFLKEHGICRVVPARELSLNEIRRIKENTGIEIECFIHGAMCYCYSGQCLFSSILGGRSGNRGRCAQPCRLPYTVGNHEEFYPLSMKDMCTLDLLPELIEAGIDSFKIEGRMKKPAYAAGVTSIYRKYIDLYYSGKSYHVSGEDREFLSSLYIRSEVGEGYYHQKNGKNMLTLDSPAYSATDHAILEKIEDQYLNSQKKIEIDAVASLNQGNSVTLCLTDGEVTVSASGAVVQKAQKQPLREEDVRKQISKMGNTSFSVRDLQLFMDEDSFLTVRDLNTLRRDAVLQLEDARILQNGFPIERSMENDFTKETPEVSDARDTRNNYDPDADTSQMFDVSVMTAEQLRALPEKGTIRRIYMDYTLLAQQESLSEEWKRWKEKLYLAGPYVIREHNRKDLKDMENALQSGVFKGILFRNLETFAYFRNYLPETSLIADHNIYFWNHETVAFWSGRIAEFYLPVEQNQTEWKKLLATVTTSIQADALVYGRLPMMITANCVENTTGGCRHETGITWLTDRYHTKFPVLHNCRSCYNIIYNSVPLSLHSFVEKQISRINHYRLDFTTESSSETAETFCYFADLLYGRKGNIPYREYTTGHIKRGVE